MMELNSSVWIDSGYTGCKLTTVIWKPWPMHLWILMTANTLLVIWKLLKFPVHQFSGLQPWRLTRRGMVSQDTFYILPFPWMYSSSLWMFCGIPTKVFFFPPTILYIHLWQPCILPTKLPHVNEIKSINPCRCLALIESSWNVKAM